MSSARAGRPLSLADQKTAATIRSLNQERAALRAVLYAIERNEAPEIELDGQKWIDREWLMIKLHTALPS